jgi:hypothetical protein
MLGCNHSEYDLEPGCTDPGGLGWIAAWYFIVFIVLGVMVLLSLFVGVIITSMELLKEGLKEEKNIMDKVRLIQDKYAISDSSVDHLLEIFDMIDVGSNGKLTLDELKPVLSIVSITPQQEFEMFVQVDTDRSGQIDFSEFCELIQLIGGIYLDDEEKKGAKIIKRTKTYRRGLNERSLRFVRSEKKQSKYNQVKFSDNASVNSSILMLPRGGSSGSLVSHTKVTSMSPAKDDQESIRNYVDDDLDKPLTPQRNRRKSREEIPGVVETTVGHRRVSAGLWSTFENFSVSPRNEKNRPESRSTVNHHDHQSGFTLGSGHMSPFPSAVNVFGVEQMNTGSISPRFETDFDDKEQPHLIRVNSVASHKLAILSNMGVLEKEVHQKALEPEYRLHQLRDSLTLADASMHSIPNINDFSMFTQIEAETGLHGNKHKSTAATAHGTFDTCDNQKRPKAEQSLDRHENNNKNVKCSRVKSSFDLQEKMISSGVWEVPDGQDPMADV